MNCIQLDEGCKQCYRFLCNPYPNSWWEQQRYTLTLLLSFSISTHQRNRETIKLFHGEEYLVYESFHQTTIQKKKKRRFYKIISVQNDFNALLRLIPCSCLLTLHMKGFKAKVQKTRKKNVTFIYKWQWKYFEHRHIKFLKSKPKLMFLF